MEQATLQSNAAYSQEQEGMLSDLNSWATLQGLLGKLTKEEDIKFLMRAEQQGKDRIRILDRLYSRYNVLRRERERRELSEGKLPF